ncbi:MAG: LicD family protein [Bacillales bacterium]|nr:LicD family protein [Bacillales bacterium]
MLNLEELKEIELNMLIKLDKFFKENNINYALDSGTLLGAVRHKGFIPWDDDIDLIVPRKDYNRLIELMKKNPPQGLKLINYETYDYYPYFFAKIISTDTTLTEDRFKHLEPIGVFIDIFPLDCVPNGKIHSLWYKFRFNWYSFLVSVLSYGKKNMLNPWYIRFCTAFFSLFPINFNKVHEKMNKYINSFDIDKCDILTTHLLNVRKDKTLPFVIDENVTFEGRVFPIPNDKEYMLRTLYNDYMQLPPEDQRKPIHYFTAERLN